MMAGTFISALMSTWLTQTEQRRDNRFGSWYRNPNVPKIRKVLIR